MTKDLIAMLLAGGMGSRLNILVSKRAKPALPFGAIYRIIDFTLSNIANSHIDVVGVLTQYKPLSLMEHLDGGRPWDLFGRTRLVEILPPKTGEEISDWYKGTSDAIYQNIGFIDDFGPELVLIVSGDHIYSMDYNELITFHREHQAEATICLVRVPPEDVQHFGIAETDGKGRINSWIEKPKSSKSNLASMGVYLFNRSRLVEMLNRAARSGGTDFARDIIPPLLKRKRVFGYVFNGYWRDVGTIQAYWQTNMDMLQPDSGLDVKNWNIKTNLAAKGEVGDRPSTYIARASSVANSLIARGCVIQGKVSNSVLSPGVSVGKGAEIIDSIIFHDTTIGARSLVQSSIIDKLVNVGSSARIGVGESLPNKRFPKHLAKGISIIGKGATVASGISVGKNCIIMPDAQLVSAKHKIVRSGSTI
ncbi:MAG: glucose-1-phosphate adenylyltransferase [candidate division WOR-3 bacterium]|nr:MAG: glucose-1-phosphate adenylyltransferase [candidate division WOR-3 bacterium]